MIKVYLRIKCIISTNGVNTFFYISINFRLKKLSIKSQKTHSNITMCKFIRYYKGKTQFVQHEGHLLLVNSNKNNSFQGSKLLIDNPTMYVLSV